MQFRLEDNVPNVYVDRSRDFQLLCRIIDVYLCGSMNRAANMRNQLDLDRCSEDLLWAIAYMQGFTTKKFMPPEVLRNVCRVFPYCIKRKGTAEAVRVAAYAVLSVDRLISSIEVTPISGSAGNEEGITQEPYTIYIECNVQSTYRSPYLQYLDEVLTFLLPTGYAPIYSVLIRTEKEPTATFSTSHTISYLAGITGRIMQGTAMKYSQDTSKGMSVWEGEYSRVGYSKIIAIGSSDKLNSEEHIPLVKGSKIKLINDSHNTVFVGNNINVTSDGTELDLSGGQSSAG